jgi:hypothetical protein
MTRLLNDSLHINQVEFCEFSGFLNGVAEGSVFLGIYPNISNKWFSFIFKVGEVLKD